MDEIIQKIVSGIQSQAEKQLPAEIKSDKGTMENLLTAVTSLAVPELKKKVENPVEHADEIKTLFDFMKKTGGKKNTTVNQQDQSNLLGALFGNKQENVISKLAGESGLTQSSAQSLIGIVVPLVLSFLGKNLKSKNGLNNLLAMLGVKNGSLLENAESVLKLFSGKNSGLNAIKGLFGKGLF